MHKSLFAITLLCALAAGCASTPSQEPGAAQIEYDSRKSEMIHNLYAGNSSQLVRRLLGEPDSYADSIETDKGTGEDDRLAGSSRAPAYARTWVYELNGERYQLVFRGDSAEEASLVEVLRDNAAIDIADPSNAPGVEGCVIGDCKNGFGVYVIANGDKYVGEFRNGTRHGQGSYTFGEGQWAGDKYAGQWRSGRRNGEGVYYYVDGKVETGLYKDGERIQLYSVGRQQTGDLAIPDKANCITGNCSNGFGSYVTAGGDKYEGQFRDGKLNGQGLVYYAGGDRYVGTFRDNIMDGDGTYLFAEGKWAGDEYTGQWQAGRRTGQGTYTWANGDKYVGQWKDGKRDGRGTFYQADGLFISGYWRDDKRLSTVPDTTSGAGQPE